MSRSILVVCTGNICRSPYGEEKLRKLLPNFEVASAGLATKMNRLSGKKADSLAIKVASEFGVDISGHKAQQITQKLIDEHDLILVMEPRQKEALCDYHPADSHKIHLFGKWVGLEHIDDPYRQGKHAFLAAFTAIDKSAQAWADNLA
ncbi:low molecular weight protein-tyrosine-phosphatase [Vibrio sp. HN007]|uniref:low molecular weight protein-tyrosine-phosphatase n=1 Tax=Vibrio iocasae TaxID=3098914 RepID=UPI0035D420D4